MVQVERILVRLVVVQVGRILVLVVVQVVVLVQVLVQGQAQQDSILVVWARVVVEVRVLVEVRVGVRVLRSTWEASWGLSEVHRYVAPNVTRFHQGFKVSLGFQRGPQVEVILRKEQGQIQMFHRS